MMTKNEIEDYLNAENLELDTNVLEQIEVYRNSAIYKKNELDANYFWILKQIFSIQHHFLTIYSELITRKYESAWRILERADIELSFLESNFNIPTFFDDMYHLSFIKRMIPEYQKLFPYHYFLSRESIIKKEQCTICNKIIGIRNSCEHRIGKLYMGELCTRKVIDYEFLGISIVKDPFDKYTVIHPEEKEYNYQVIELLIQNIYSPFDCWYIDESPIISLDYKNIGRNSLCPCHSGKKYKNCCLGTDKIYTTHYRINLLNQEKRDIQKPFFVSTWK